VREVISVWVIAPLVPQVVDQRSNAFNDAPFLAKLIRDVPSWLLQADTIFCEDEARHRWRNFDSFESSLKEPLSNRLSRIFLFWVINLHFLQAVEQGIVARAMRQCHQMCIELEVVPGKRCNVSWTAIMVHAASIRVLHNSEIIWASGTVACSAVLGSGEKNLSMNDVGYTSVFD